MTGEKNDKTFIWKVINSAWICLSLIGMGWVGFLIIGSKSNNTRWKKLGIKYGIIQMFLFFSIAILPNGSSRNSATYLWLMVIFINFIHSIIINRYYLDYKARASKNNINKLDDVEIKPIDINNCTEDDLANLPGISVVQAKKAIQHREMNGMYISLEQFYEITEIKPHFIAKLKNMLSCSYNEDTYREVVSNDNKEDMRDKDAKEDSDKSRGRILDI